MKIMKKKRKINKKNGGFSLLEVVVTIMVVAVISIPIISSFTSSAKVNQIARRKQNATDLAQNLAEVFDSFSVDALVSKYKGEFGESCHTSEEISGMGFPSKVYKHTFSELEFTGAEGEPFKVNITMTPQEVNVIPSLRNLYGNTETVCIKEITRYDERAAKDIDTKLGLNTFASITDRKLIEEKLENYKKEIKKKTDFYITLNENGEYEYKLQMTYTSIKNTSAKYTSPEVIFESGELKSGENKFKPLYILYSPYDKRNVGTGVAEDEVTIHYSENFSNPKEIKPVDVYFINTFDEKEINKIKVKESNIKFMIDEGNGKESVADASLLPSKGFNFKFINDSEGEKGITDGERVNVVYNLLFEVRYRDESDAIIELKADKDSIEKLVKP